MDERLRRSRSHSRATREIPRDGPCESNDEFDETTMVPISQIAELDTLKEADGANDAEVR